MKAGDYVRTKDGYIDRIKKIEVEYHERGNDEGEKPYEIYELKNEYFDEEFNETSCWVFEDFIKKSSPSIIDLIEVGDYVNGMKITDIKKDLLGNVEYVFGYSREGFEGETMYYDDEIKSILTKEQFESMEYKVESKVN